MLAACINATDNAVLTVTYLHISKTHLHINWWDVGIHQLSWRCIRHSRYWHGNCMSLATRYPTSVVNWTLKIVSA